MPSVARAATSPPIGGLNTVVPVPRDRLAKPLLGWPFTVLETIPFRMQRWFPSWRRGVQVTGVWGWPAVPDPVRQATLIYAHKLFKRADSPLGVQAITPDAPGVVIRKRDPDADALLAPYVRALVAA